MRYVENHDPGFREYRLEDFAAEEETSQSELRMELLHSIAVEFDRLGLNAEAKSYLAHYHGLGSDPMTASLLDLRLFLDWLKRIDRVQMKG